MAYMDVFSKPVAVTVAAKWSRDFGMKLAKKYTIDFGKCNPNHNGSDVGINYPFHSKQIPYDPRGKPYLLNNSNTESDLIIIHTLLLQQI